MTDDDMLAALDAALAQLAAAAAAGEEAHSKESAGTYARLATAEDPELMALLTPNSRGTYVGPWIMLTCPRGHHLAPIRAVMHYRYAGAHLEVGGKHRERTRRELFQESDSARTPFFGAMPKHRQDHRLTDRRTWTCAAPRCGWSAPVSEAFLLRLYREAATRRLRRAPLARPS